MPTMRWTVVIPAVIVAAVLLGCAKKEEQKQKVWTVSELKALKGRTREEITGLLGKPTGFFTIENKGRFHYPGMLITREGSPTPDKKGVIFYFSELGDHRCTIVEIMDRWEGSKDKKPD